MMEIQETGIAILLSRAEQRALYAEIALVLTSHDDWSQYPGRASTIPIIGRIFDDLYRRGMSTGTTSETSTGETPIFQATRKNGGIT